MRPFPSRDGYTTMTATYAEAHPSHSDESGNDDDAPFADYYYPAMGPEATAA